MFERFNGDARRTIVIAQEESRAFNHAHIGTEHLAVALSQGDTLAGKALSKQGVKTEALRGQVIEIIGLGKDPSPGHLPFTPDARTVIEDAAETSVRMGHDHVGAGHLLLAITMFQSDGFRALVRSGANPDRLSENIREAMTASTSTRKEAMELEIVDTSLGKQHLAHKITRTARCLLPRDRQPARDTVLQAVVVSAPLDKDSSARALVLDDGFAWTEILSLPASEWRAQVPLPDPHGEVAGDRLAALADDLLARAVRILGA